MGHSLSIGLVDGLSPSPPVSISNKPDLPYCVWVEMDDYCGESFFPAEDGRDKWVPIYPRTHRELHKQTNGAWVEEERTMIPLRLAWAWTIHKSQGQTIRSKIVLNLGKKEMDHGVEVNNSKQSPDNRSTIRYVQSTSLLLSTQFLFSL
jgi:hypothetical protein